MTFKNKETVYILYTKYVLPKHMLLYVTILCLGPPPGTVSRGDLIPWPTSSPGSGEPSNFECKYKCVYTFCIVENTKNKCLESQCTVNYLFMRLRNNPLFSFILRFNSQIRNKLKFQIVFEMYLFQILL